MGKLLIGKCFIRFFFYFFSLKLMPGCVEAWGSLGVGVCGVSPAGQGWGGRQGTAPAPGHQASPWDRPRMLACR